MQIRDGSGPVQDNNEHQGELASPALLVNPPDTLPVARDPSNSQTAQNTIADHSERDHAPDSSLSRDLQDSSNHEGAISDTDKSSEDTTRQDELIPNSQRQIDSENNFKFSEDGSSYKSENSFDKTKTLQLKDFDIFAAENSSGDEKTESAPRDIKAQNLSQLMSTDIFSEMNGDEKNECDSKSPSSSFGDLPSSYLKDSPISQNDSKEKQWCNESINSFENPRDGFKKYIATAILNHRNRLRNKSTDVVDEDIANYVPGFYRLLELHKEDGSNGLGTLF
ncbi:1585_t:CDS:2 [Acaulospora colombiana]|uniref:1585_t:CDS:1 n=1 Tax=Acaulospora colombiana TaxID=27376 RepID=A0ACA9KYZ6_9GLOM|nr:1585_t:CDS:2 [Acaulospora colombiana]